MEKKVTLCTSLPDPTLDIWGLLTSLRALFSCKNMSCLFVDLMETWLLASETLRGVHMNTSDLWDFHSAKLVRLKPLANIPESGNCTSIINLSYQDGSEGSPSNPAKFGNQDYAQLTDNCLGRGRLFVDSTFPPENQSLGDLPDLASWQENQME
ncbi:hypothetical protein L3Q82_006520 [Scortum barcoo]|uniref:Uncharacterized protein n=1 Tax=Scortum barcoo TaxID=214431 RepID=A0ACB8WZI6_9TELE|nr:hypothetical protein L3Q82_006520 [Scortum barcoo]